MDLTTAVIIWIVCAIASYVIASNKGAANPGTWAVVGLLLGPIGILAALVGAKRA